MPEITVYGQPHCQGCTATRRHLARAGVKFLARDVTDSDTARAEVEALGYSSLPVVVAGDMHWSGYRPDKLNQLVKALGTAPDIAPLEADAAAYLATGTEVA